MIKVSNENKDKDEAKLQRELEAALDFVELIKEMGFKKFIEISILKGYIDNDRCWVEALYQTMIEKLASIEDYDKCAYVRDKYQEFKDENWKD